MYHLNDKEKQRLVEAIRAVYTIPFVDDIEDYIWEAIFTYSKDIPSVDPLTNIRSKNLFDVVDKKRALLHEYLVVVVVFFRLRFSLFGLWGTIRV